MTVVRAIVLALVLASLLACSGGAPRRTAELMAIDYQTMSDQELQTHYARVTDQLARESRAERMGRRGRDAAREPEEPSPLREHWNAVRHEMRQRDLLP